MRKTAAVFVTTVVLSPGIAACGWEPETVGPQRDPTWTVRRPAGSGRFLHAAIAGDVVLVEVDRAVVALEKTIAVPPEIRAISGRSAPMRSSSKLSM